MSKFVNVICQNDGYVERVAQDDVEPIEIGKMIESVVLPIRSGAGVVQINRKHPEWTAAGEIQGKQAMFAVLSNGEPVADIAICLHSRSAEGLWSQFTASAPARLDLVDTLYPESPPWAAVRWMYQPQDWLERWVLVLAYTLGTEKERHRKEMGKRLKK